MIQVSDLPLENHPGYYRDIMEIQLKRYISLPSDIKRLNILGNLLTPNSYLTAKGVVTLALDYSHGYAVAIPLEKNFNDPILIAFQERTADLALSEKPTVIVSFQINTQTYSKRNTQSFYEVFEKNMRMRGSTEVLTEVSAPSALLRILQGRLGYAPIKSYTLDAKKFVIVSKQLKPW